MIFFATCPLGVADLLAAELKDLGATRAREMKSGVEFDGELEVAYRACLWSRTANRILLQLAIIEVRSAADLYKGVQTIDWSEHLKASGTLAVDFSGSVPGITHTQFGALKTKDAIVDQLREKFGERPSVDLERPDVRINVHAHREQATISIDLSGESLHRRGYRVRGVAAPLKENLAAAILLRAGWPAIAQAGGGLVDPMCGSGTFVIEAALIAADIAPGIAREYFGFLNWQRHDVALWSKLIEEANTRRSKNLSALPCGILHGYDRDSSAVRAATENMQRAGLSGLMNFYRRELSELSAPSTDPGLVVVNPPYGERIGDQSTLRDLYALFGKQLREHFVGWKAAVLTGNPPLARDIGIHAKRSHTLFNGALECRLLRFDVQPEHFDAPENRPTRDDRLAEARQRPGAEMFANRLRKNVKAMRSWARKENIECYRVYDADMPEYSFAIDLYNSAEPRVYVQEYEAPDTIERGAASARRLEALSVIPEVFQLPTERMHVRMRRQQKGTSQYEKVDREHEFLVVQEGAYQFLVNFTDYLDTGLFFDHRITRRKLGEMAKGKRFLNLFAYTGTATVYAAGGGACSTTTIDMSNTYIDWAKRNLNINNLAGPQHEFIQADCLAWLSEQPARAFDPKPHGPNPRPELYDLIFVDPPTFSRSKRMEDTFEVQRDHVKLLELTATLLAPGGTIVFSNNYTRFKIDREALKEFHIDDITRATIPKDFERNPKIHSCFLVSRAK
ncbi:MAG: bifunctional 23S rRNA (guanine(2069)-N(7))-methyltransferase RlmK/23S rRNA (guanine(2445)-N(2))-methyltransferase RlmL [Candidatus Obscuribacterales bacterium]|nr:bifunctional 23S rRNA (guanine(2069)-N(7))-methyltransferase RlmK/23S rRNA (guanine(2445)-N(2))-methyltransferase RlmL [Steroidobacteraceae bacterium]